MKKIEKIDRKNWPLHRRDYLLDKGTETIILDKLDEFVDRLNEQGKENERIWKNLLTLQQRLTDHSHFTSGMPSY